MSTDTAPGFPEEPIRTDGDRSIRMKLATLIAIVVFAAASASWGYSIKSDVTAQGNQLALLNQKQNTLTEMVVELRIKNSLMDQKLDYLTGGSRGRPPATATHNTGNGP